MTQDEPVLSDIWDDWSAVRPALQNLCDDNPAFDLKPEFIRDACSKEQADYWRVPDGFLVTRFITDDDTGVRTLFMWVSCSFKCGGDIGSKYLPFFTEVAKYTECKYIEAWSSRPGMGRYLAKQGFGEFYRSFRKEVSNG